MERRRRQATRTPSLIPRQRPAKGHQDLIAVRAEYTRALLRQWAGRWLSLDAPR